MKTFILKQDNNKITYEIHYNEKGYPTYGDIHYHNGLDIKAIYGYVSITEARQHYLEYFNNKLFRPYTYEEELVIMQEIQAKMDSAKLSIKQEGSVIRKLDLEKLNEFAEKHFAYKVKPHFRSAYPMNGKVVVPHVVNIILLSPKNRDIVDELHAKYKADNEAEYSKYGTIITAKDWLISQGAAEYPKLLEMLTKVDYPNTSPKTRKTRKKIK